jgi:hypothetical protein
VREELRAACHGPGNASMQHFHDPMAIIDKLSTTSGNRQGSGMTGQI